MSKFLIRGAAVCAVLALVKLTLPDIKRYLRLRRM
ncbi:MULTISPECIES: DUF6893 family small protein [unclassified Kitasatospora]